MQLDKIFIFARASCKNTEFNKQENVIFLSSKYKATPGQFINQATA